MKTCKRIISFMLCAVMVFGIFAEAGDISSLFSIDASAADITLGGITQKRVVSNYESIYAQYQARFFTGKNSNSPTNFVIPGLSSNDKYTPQGMTYWEEKEWILISAYDASGNGKHSVIYAIDAKTTEFVALFKILNANGSVNTSHGGGIAASKYNFYYADSGSNISYFPLSELDVPKNTVKEVRLRGSIDCGGELGGAATSYCCYEDGVLWAGNFYLAGNASWGTSAHSAANSMIVGYELHGNSSAEEWYYLCYSRGMRLNSTSEQTAGAMKYTTTFDNKNNVQITGSISADGATGGEITANFGAFQLVEGQTYTIEFISTNNLTDAYMFSPSGTHCNVKQSQQSKITPLADGRYHYSMTFTAGLRPTGADSSWPTTQSTDGSYTGKYTVRFDQDSVSAARSFTISNFVIKNHADSSFEASVAYEGIGCAGNPTHVILFPGIDKIQYAMVFKGRIYVSRSYVRREVSNHTRELMVGDIDIGAPGSNENDVYTINGKSRICHVLNVNNMTRFGGDNGSSKLNQMLYMGEALCVMNDHLYMFGESAAWYYYGDGSTGGDGGASCPEPIDIIWKIDQYAIMGEERPREDVALSHYEKVWSLEELNTDDHYIVVYESELKDPVTQKNILYAIDAFGGYGAKKLPKQDNATQKSSGDSMGIVGYPITTYSHSDDGEILYIEDEDDANRSIRWKLKSSNIADESGGKKATIKMSNTDLYYNKNANLYFGSRLITMKTDSGANLDNVKAVTYGDGKFYLYYEGTTNYFLWCNDGSVPAYIDTYTNHYLNHGRTDIVPSYHGLEEKPGTFHADGLYYKDDANSGNLMHEGVDSKYGAFHIYKRVADTYADTYDSRVYTDLNAELQADGTYTIDLETYAIGSTQYKVLDKERPTDFIFVLDTSGSMGDQDCNGYHRHNSFDLEAAAGTQDAAANSTDDLDKKREIGTYTGNMWVQHTDGEMCRVSVRTVGDGRGSWNVGAAGYNRYLKAYVWYTHPNGTKYWYHPNSGTWTTTETSYDEAQRIGGAKKADRYNTNVFSGVCYEKRSNSSRLSNLQIAVNQLTWKIQENAKSSGLDHRIAVVQYGSNSNGSWTNTGMYTNSGTSRVGYTGAGTVSAANYQKAFHTVSQFGNVRNIIDNFTASGDTFVDAGMDMAYNIVTHSDANYLAGGNRSACIIMITDGCPGFGGNDSSTANTVANAAIKNAYKAKDAGAYVYTVQMGNNSMSGFDMGTYMDNVSSEFIDAQSMTDSGERNVREIEYRIDVPISGFNLDFLVNSIFNSVTSNSRNALAKLDASSLLHAEITEAFDLSNATVTAKLADAAYDGLDRLYFKDPLTTAGITVNYNKTQQSVDVSGYNYSEYYVSKSNADAKKLIVTFEGVVPNVDMELNDTNINNTETTAIYQKSGGMEFKKFPTEHFTMPEYTYVLDFDLPMLDTDVNGTLVSVDTLPQKQDVNNYTELLYTDNSDVIVGFANSNQDLVYSLRDGASNDTERSRAYVLIQRPDETYDWFKLNILPASNVLYGDYDKFNEAGHSSYPNAEDWSIVGSKSTNYQSLTSTEDVYGFDEAYDVAGNIFSAGNAYSASVSDSNPRTKTLSFKYTGTAIDIISACGPETGIQIVTIKNSAGKTEKIYIVDTYYTDSAYLSDGLLRQVPIIHHENVNGYGTYTVEITGAYLSSMVNARPLARTLRSDDTVSFWSPVSADMVAEAVLENVGMEDLLGENIEVLFADENSVFNGGTGATGSAASTFARTRAVSDRPLASLENYFDGFRVYNPLDDMTGAYVESEQGSQYYNIVNSLASSDDIITGAESVVGYVEGGSYETINFADYAASKAPMNEIYLSNSQLSGVAFNLTASTEAKVMVSLRAVNGPTKAKVNNKEINVNSATEMYFDITDAIDLSNENPVVTIQNIGSGLLSVCNIKVVNGGLAPMMMSALPRVRMMMAAPVEEEVPEEPVVLPEITPNPGGTGNDPDLDVESSIPDYVPEDSGASSDSNGFMNAFVSFIDAIKSFFEKMITFITSFFA